MPRNPEIAAMGRLSRTFERELEGLDEPSSKRVLNWFLSWAMDRQDQLDRPDAAEWRPPVPPEDGVTPQSKPGAVK